MSQYIYFIGIDVSKQHLDHPVVQDEKVLTNKRSTSTPKAILKAVKGLQKQVKGLNLANTLFSLEHTGIDAHINEIDATPLSALLFQTGYLTIQDYKVASVYGLLYPRAMLLMNLMVFVSNQSEGELFIGYEFLVRLLAICADAYDLVPCLLEGLIVIL